MHINLVNAFLLPCSLRPQFSQLTEATVELEGYLAAAQAAAAETEQQALAAADVELTPAWRKTGIPLKPSYLALEPEKTQEGALVNPKAILNGFDEYQKAEVLLPPKTYAFNDKTIEANHLKDTFVVAVSGGWSFPSAFSKAAVSPNGSVSVDVLNLQVVMFALLRPIMLPIPALLASATATAASLTVRCGQPDATPSDRASSSLSPHPAEPRRQPSGHHQQRQGAPHGPQQVGDAPKRGAGGQAGGGQRPAGRRQQAHAGD